MLQTIERTALTQLVSNEEYARKVLPFIKRDYFSDRIERTIFEEITKFVEKYKKIPTQTSLEIEVQSRKDLNETDFKKVISVIKTLKTDENVNFDWLVDTTEQFCKDKAVYNAIVEGIQIIDGKDKSRNADAIPNILTEALSVGFDNTVGHDYLLDSDSRYDYYHKIEEKIPFDLEFFNKITKGGLPPKTLNIVLAGTGVGKSLFMCHVSANCLAQGKNVLYITLEMAEERVAERIDANLMNISMEDLYDLPKRMYDDKIQKIKKSTTGKLIVKEYPTASAHSGHFRGLIKELALKKSFKPDILFI
ncbi:MAG TPA: DNA primase, partial [Nitrososphaerales archaeon]|nr:DNA primase [Nitrososphaerales archaeon]